MALSTFEDPDEKRKVDEDGTDFQNDELEITLIESLEGAKDHPMVTVDISSIFVPFVDEPRDLPKNPGEALNKLLWMWWNDPQSSASQRSISDCFGPNPALYYYALKHFSDPGLSFSAEERADLSRKLLHHVGCFISDTSQLTDNRSLEFGWYFFVRLLTIEDQIRSQVDSPLKEEHLSLLHDQYAYVIQHLYEAKRNGYLTIPSLFGWLEKKLIDLGRAYPHLIPLIRPFLKQEILDETSQTVSHIQQEMMDKYWILFTHEQEKEGGWEHDKQLQEKIQRAITRFRHALRPKEDDMAWEKPVEYIMQCARDKKIICCDQQYPIGSQREDDEQGEVLCVDAVELDMLSRFSSKNTAWVFANAQARICPFHDILEKCGIPKSLSDILQLMEAYLNGDVRDESIEQLLGLQGESNKYVDYCKTYWNTVRNIRQKNRIFLLNELLESDRARPLSIVPNFAQTVIFDNGGATQELIMSGIPSSDIFMIHHQIADDGYPEDHVCIPACLGYVAHGLGNKHGWGNHDSSATSINGNKLLMQAVFNNDCADQLEEFLNMYAVLNKNGTNRTWICKDMILFTKHDDEGDSDAPFHPVHSDSYVPVGS